MSQAQSIPSASGRGHRSPDAKLGRLPAEALQSYQRFADTGEEGALSTLVFEVLSYHLPKNSAATAGTAWPDEVRLIEDLGYDSLAMIETVFFFEDLFQITVSNEEVVTVKTVGDLRRFIRSKLESSKS